MNAQFKSSASLNRVFLLSSLAVGITGVFDPQTAYAAAKQEARSIEEVVVTARRREESLQDVPVAVSAFGAKQIKERGIETEADLQISTPGLQVRVTNSSNQLNYSIRGQTVDSFSNSQPAVLAYVNEVQAGGVSASALFDMESIQVLKGPQGTLFGRNATGGAVLYQTKRPDEDFGGYITLGVGNDSDKMVEGAINVPLSDTLAMRLAGMTRERDGWQKNLYNGDDLASIDTDNVRFSLSYRGDKVSNHLTAYYADHGGKTEGLRLRNAYNMGDTNPSDPSVSIGPDQPTFATLLYFPGIIGSGLLDTDNPRVVELGNEFGFTGFGEYAAVQRSLDLDQVMNDQSNENDIQHFLFGNTTEIELSESMTLKNIIGYNKVDSTQLTDVDGSPFMVLRMGDEHTDNLGYLYNTEQFSNELQLAGEMLSGDLSYILGVYYYKEEFENNIPLKFAADYLDGILDVPPPAGFGPAFAYHALSEDESKSVFVQGTYALTDNTNFTAGYRHTWEEVSIQHYPDSAYALGAGLTDKFTQKVDRPSWLLSLDYRINDENMVYLSHRGSWRTGGFNNTSINITPNGIVPDSFKPEKAWDIEAGWKFSGLIGDVPARINMAAYQQTVEDVQRTVYLDVTSLTGNVQETEVKGIEIDAQFDLTSWLEVGGMIAWTDAEFTKPLGDVVGYNFAFGPYADAPEYQWSVYFLAQTDIEGLGHLTFRGDYYSNDDTYFSNLNDTIGPGTELDGYELLNVRAALEEIAGTGFSVVGYVRNVTDEEYERGGLPLAGVLGTNATIAGEPRTWGVELTYTF